MSSDVEDESWGRVLLGGRWQRCVFCVIGAPWCFIADVVAMSLSCCCCQRCCKRAQIHILAMCVATLSIFSIAAILFSCWATHLKAAYAASQNLPTLVTFHDPVVTIQLSTDFLSMIRNLIVCLWIQLLLLGLLFVKTVQLVGMCLMYAPGTTGVVVVLVAIGSRT